MCFRFGYVPHSELMQFIAAATSGAYLVSCPDVTMVQSFYIDLSFSHYSNILKCLSKL